MRPYDSPYTRNYRYRTFGANWTIVPNVARVTAEGQYAVFYAADSTVILMVAWNNAIMVEPVPVEDS